MFWFKEKLKKGTITKSWGRATKIVGFKKGGSHGREVAYTFLDESEKTLYETEETFRFHTDYIIEHDDGLL